MSFIPWWVHYPNVNNEILNLDWLLKVSNCNTHKIENFINFNTIKYADPILWNITSQYEANTVVVDGQTGNAYISTKAVPSGVHLNRTEYWTQIYNYADALGDLRKQIAFDEGNTTTATRPFVIGDLVFVNELLYRVIAPMIAGDSFVVDSNVIKTTIEEELKRLNDSLDDEIEARTEADNTLSVRIDDEIEARTEADNTLSGRIDDEVEARTEADNALTDKINKLNHNPVNVLTLGFDNTGLTPNDELFAEYTSQYDLYFPAGTYLFNEAIHPIHNIYGIGNTWGWENGDNNQFSMLKCVDDEYVIIIDNPSGDLIIDGLILNPNFNGGGLKLATSQYSTNVFKNITVINNKTRGFSIEPTTLQSRCFTIDSCMVFGMGQVSTIAYYVSINAPDGRITNSYASQIQISIRAECNILTLSNIHTWSGIVSGTISDDWYGNTKGLSLNNCTIYASNLYLDTHFIPIYCDSVGRSKVFIDNISIWYDNTIAGTSRTDGSLAYGNVDVYINKGLIYPGIYLPYVGAYDNVKMKNVVIKTDETMSNSNWQKFPLTPSNNIYEISNTPTGTQYVEIAKGHVSEWGIAHINMVDNYGNDVTVNYKNIEGTIAVTKVNNNGSAGLYYKIVDNVITIYKAIARFSYNNITVTGSVGLRFINYNLVTRNDNTPYIREVLNSASGLTEIQLEV